MKFNVPNDRFEECILWLWDNVGPGNLVPEKHKDTSYNEYAWVYQVDVDRDTSFHDLYTELSLKPTVTIEDEEKAMLFALRWS